MSVKKLALYGSPGAGKSTTTKLLIDLCADRQIIMRRLRLADPLYECQNALYQIAGKPLASFYVQDGELLNFLGSHLRKINPSVLTDRFDKKLQDTLAEMDGRSSNSLIVCDDMRQPDYEFISELKFIVVKIQASHETCIERRRSRGDISLESSQHPTEQGLDTIKPDHIITNNGTLADLKTEVTSFLHELFDDFNQP